MIHRRHFLQLAGSTLATIGLSQYNITQQGNRYAKVLAQNTPRKLALLVGINKYPTNDRFVNLQGCVTDVKLQRELLVHRFGFNDSDILCLTSDATDKQPTRSNILTAFEEHLIKQAKPGDAVVFHFSGHGSQLSELDPIQKCRNLENNSTFVPSDAELNGLPQDIMGRTLFLLMSAVNTENFTAVLDSCYSGGGTRDKFLIRSVPGDNIKPSPEEIAYQKRWMEQMKISNEEIARRRCENVAKGAVLAACRPDEAAKDATFNGFNAGLFTYFLTQYLWQQTDNFKNVIARITPGVKADNFSQTPLIDLSNSNSNKSIYFINKKSLPVDAVVTKQEGDGATLWLGGINNDNLEAFDKGATFTIISEKGQTSGELLVESRNGLEAKARLVKKVISLKPGMLLQETSRVIPADLKLNIGLDASLAEEANAAIEALSKINRIEAVPAQLGKISTYPKDVQYIFRRMTSENSIGLFTKGLAPMPEFFGKKEETVVETISRLEPKLKSLVATHIIKKTLNANSSNLDVEVSMNLVDKPNQILAKTSTKLAKNNRRESAQTYSNKLPTNKLFQFQVKNGDKSALNLAILLIDSNAGDLVVVFPYEWSATSESMRLEANSTKLIGDPQQLQLKAAGRGTGEALIIVSRNPLKNAVKTLQNLAAEQNRSQGELQLKEPVEVIGDLLSDLSGERGGTSQASQIKTSDIATLSISFEVG